MKYRVFLILAAMLLGACGEKEEVAPIKIESRTIMNSYKPNLPYRIEVYVTSLVDDIEVEDIVVNRGNCKSPFYQLTGETRYKLPKRLKYGEIATMEFELPCQVMQVDVSTNKGNWAMNYN